LLSIVLGMIAISMGHCFWLHYFLMGATGLVLACVLGAETLSEFLTEKGALVSTIAFAVLFGGLFFVGRDVTKTVLQQPTAYHPYEWDPLVVQTIEQHSKPGDYILTTEGPLLYVAMDRQNPIGLNFFVDEILPYVTGENRMLKMEILRADLEKHLPKVCYFPAWIRPRQNRWHELLFDPLIAKHHYVKVNELLWYLPEE
jgi:hypothetical protein